ncbi:MAG: hypothetical protein ACUVX9_05650 [Anaerolineae bacterium]
MFDRHTERVEHAERAELQDRQRARRRAELGLRVQRLREREAREWYDLECAQRLRRQKGLSPEQAASLCELDRLHGLHQALSAWSAQTEQYAQEAQDIPSRLAYNQVAHGLKDHQQVLREALQAQTGQALPAGPRDPRPEG